MRVQRPLTLGARVSLATAGAVLMVLAGFGLALHHFLQGAVVAWEREHLAALGHHAAEMVAAEPPGEREETALRLADDVEAFGVELRWLGPGRAEESVSVGAVRVPVAGTGAELRLTSSRPAGETLGRRLFVLYASLLVTLSAALAVAVQGSVYWGLARPLRTIRKQLQQMHRGPWRTAAATRGVAEVVSLAREIEAVGLALEQRVPAWVEAERKAGTELARRALQSAVLPELREVNALLGDVQARGGAPPKTVRALRRARVASDRIARHLDTAVADELAGPVPAPPGGSEKGFARRTRRPIVRQPADWRPS